MIEAIGSRLVRRQAQVDSNHVPSGVHVPMPELSMVVFGATRKADADAVNLLGADAARHGTTNAVGANLQTRIASFV